MNEQFAVATHDLDTRLKDLKDQVANLAIENYGWKTLTCLAAVNGYVSTCLELGSISYDVAERILWHVQEAIATSLDSRADFRDALTLAEDILADMPLPYRIVDGAL